MKEKQKLILLIVMLIVVIGSAVILYERFSQNAIEAESNVTTEANVNNNMPENNENQKSTFAPKFKNKVLNYPEYNKSISFMLIGVDLVKSYPQ